MGKYDDAIGGYSKQLKDLEDNPPSGRTWMNDREITGDIKERYDSNVGLFRRIINALIGRNN